jgi:ubiquitin carboxyl-terminal hydrolase 34
LLTPGYREIVKDIYILFAKLTATFVSLDCFILQQPHQASSGHDRRLPELYSLGYLQQFQLLTRREDLLLELEPEESAFTSTYESDDASMLLSVFLGSPGGNLDCLSRFAIALIDQASTLPRLAEGLSPICQILVNILREFLRIHRAGHDGASHAALQLTAGHELWHKISSALNATIEKHVTHLSPDSTLNQIRALTDILRICLHGEHTLAIDAVNEHQKNHPDLELRFIPEAASWKWRFDILGELIRSSQMQLRMMAVTTMCADLVAIWKRLSPMGERDGLPLLKYIGGYLLQSQLIDYILSPSCHPEIIVESANIVGFLVMTQLYTMEHTERLWQGIKSSKDPRVADALTRMITNITALFDYSGCVDLCEQLQSLPIEAFTPAMRGLWEHLFKQMLQEYSKVRQTLSFHPYNLCLRLLRESSICDASSHIAHPEIHSFAMQKFNTLLNHGPDAAGRHELYLSCIVDISAKSPTTLGSLWGLSMAIRPGLVPELQVLTEHHDFTRLLIEELEHAIQAGRIVGSLSILYGSTNQPRRDLVTNIILLQPATLNNELGKRLWGVLVGPESSCQEDRTAGWQIILDVARQTGLQNPYLQICLSQFLPTLPPMCFSDGMLDLVREEVLPLVEQADELILDDANLLSQSGVEHLWRVILTGSDKGLVTRAIHTLAVDIYIDSASIRACPLHRARQVHLSLVNRCLDQLKEAARQLRDFGVGVTSSDDELMVIVTAEKQVEEQEQVFVRSLQLLRYFLEAHQAKPYFAAPDLRSLMSDAPSQIEGDLAELKYQSFDGTHQTEVKPLNIGKLNTAASLLASLRQETGFENYRAYYKGQPFLPTEQQICRSLEDLHVHDGLILVKREADGTSPAARIKPGSSPLEIEILTHFNELWACLSMDEHLAREASVQLRSLCMPFLTLYRYIIS